MASDSDPGDEQTPEDAYWQERYRFAKRCGFDRSHARAFASSRTPMAELRDLLERGCPARLAEKILAADT